MKVSDLFYNLSIGELSNLAMSGEGSGTIRDKDQGKLVSYINAGVNALHKRFVLVTKELLIECFDHITTYQFKRKFAITSNSSEKYKYIIDYPDFPFEEDVIRILEVSNALRQKLPLNDPGDFMSVFTPAPDVLQVPEPITRNSLSVIYQAESVPLKYLGIDKEVALAQEIQIPGFLESALTNYVAYKVYSHMNGQEQQAKSQEYLVMYENECSEVEKNDLTAQTQSVTHHKLNERGFV